MPIESQIVQFLFTGIAIGSIYAMVALGFNIIYNSTGIINFAQGEFVMLGGLVMVWLSVTMGLPMPLAFVITIAAVMAAVEAAGVHVPDSMRAGTSRDDVLDLAMGTVVADSFAKDRLTFLYDFPASQAALARIRGDVASRFEAFWGPLELANGFHELGSAVEQAARFAADLEQRRTKGQSVRPVDQLFIDALAAGLPPCAGVALGFDRLVMVASGATRIDEVITFPIERA